MISSRKETRIFGRFLAAAICTASAGFAGCQPEGTSSIKGPATRPDDGSLGRPLGNAPEVAKKKPASEAAKKEVPKPANPRL